MKKAYDEFIKPTMKYADLILPFDDDNDKGVEFVVTVLKTKMKKYRKLQTKLMNQKSLSEAESDVTLE